MTSEERSAHDRVIARARSQEVDTAVLRRVSWVFLVLGIVAGGLFLSEPDVRAHPQTFLLGITGIVGSGMLRVLAWLLRTPPREP